MCFNVFKIILGLSFALVFSSCNSNQKPANASLDLSSGWIFSQEDSILDTLDFPFSLINTLYDIQEIEDPNYEDALQDIEKFIKPEHYQLVKEFNITKEDLDDKKVILNLGRIAGLADVVLNDSVVLTTESYYSKMSLDISRQLRIGVNVLNLKFKSTSSSKYYPNTQKGNEQHVSFTNLECKGPFNIDFIKSAIYSKPYVDFVKFEKDTLLTFWNIPIQSTKKQTLTFEWDFEGKTYRQSKEVQEGNVLGSIYFPIVKPKFWFPFTNGEQFMYLGVLKVFSDGDLLQSDSLKFGVKHLRWKNNNNQIEFVLNGKSIDVFAIDYNAKNWYKTNTIQETKNYITELKNLGINCIRVKGNDDYLSEEALSLLDKEGMMVWQDLHLNYLPKVWNVENKISIQSELIDLMKTYRNHPSVLSLGGKSEDRNTSKEAGLIHYEVFEQVIPEIVNTFSDLEYIPNSSYVWNDMTFNLETMSMSSYAFRNAWMREKNTDPWQNSWLSKQVSDEIAFKYYQIIENNRGVPSDLEGMIYHSEINQYKYVDSIMAVKRGLNSKTIHIPMAFSEKGPGVHASITDFFGEKKALYYTLKKLTKPQTVQTSRKNGVLTYSIKNNTKNKYSTRVEINLRNTNGDIVDQLVQELDLSANQSKPILEWNKDILPKTWMDKQVSKILEIKFDNTVERYILQFDKSEIRYADCKYKVVSNAQVEYIELLTKNYMPFTKFSTGNLGAFESNYLTCLPNDTIKIYFNSTDETSPLTTENVLFYDYSLSFD